jgi:ATP-dependent RNA helicase RhlE
VQDFLLRLHPKAEYINNNKDSFFMYQNSFRSQRSRPSTGRSFGGRPSGGPGRSGGHNGGGRRSGPQKQYIHPSKFIAEARPVAEMQYTAKYSFEDFNVDPLIKKNLAAKGYTTPSPIQDQSIPLGLEGRDIIGIANTGTGKTAAFAIPVLSKLMQSKSSSVLIVAPTRELAEQIEQEIRSIAKGSGLSGAVLIGGASMTRQLNELRHKPRVVVGTPGRIKDHIERGSLKLTNFDVVVLDEVDRMLDMGFMPDMRYILQQLSPTRQSFFFSATFDAKVRDIISEFSNDPVTISVKTGDTADNVHQNIVQYNGKEDKIAKLHDTLAKAETEKTIVFDDTKHAVERLGKELLARGFRAESIHGGKSQGQRQRALRAFKENKIDILVATDVAARGIDVPDITHVINYSTPQTYEDYVHRIGRAGRAGRVGHALTFIEN